MGTIHNVSIRSEEKGHRAKQSVGVLHIQTTHYPSTQGIARNAVRILLVTASAWSQPWRNGWPTLWPCCARSTASCATTAAFGSTWVMLTWAAARACHADGSHSDGDKQATNLGSIGMPTEKKLRASRRRDRAEIVPSKRVERGAGSGRWGLGDAAVPGLQSKNLMFQPHRVAMALQQPWLTCRECEATHHQSAYGRWPDGRPICPECLGSAGVVVETPGWIARSAITWFKLNPMPESVTGVRYIRHRVTISEYERLSRLRKEQCSAQQRPCNLPGMQTGKVSGCQETLPAEREGPGNGKGEGRTPGRERATSQFGELSARESEPDKIRGNREGQSHTAANSGTLQGQPPREDSLCVETSTNKGLASKARTAQASEQTIQPDFEGQGVEISPIRQTQEGDGFNNQPLDRRSVVDNSESTQGRCHYCGRMAKLTIDHVIPLSKGGDHSRSNVVPACQRCNSQKGNRLDWLIVPGVRNVRSMAD